VVQAVAGSSPVAHLKLGCLSGGYRVDAIAALSGFEGSYRFAATASRRKQKRVCGPAVKRCSSDARLTQHSSAAACDAIDETDDGAAIVEEEPQG
jgi:hypothetical protein